MRQRVMIAMALSLSPSVLIADEPTTALDVTIQAQILEEIRHLGRESDSGVIFVTHDLGVVADIADRVVVMYSGRVVEQGTLDEIFYDPQHPYTWGLLGSVTRMDRDPPHRLPAIPGLPPSLVNAPTGCHFRPRCPHAFDKCGEVPAAGGAFERRSRPSRPLLAGRRREAHAPRGRGRPDRARHGIGRGVSTDTAAARAGRAGRRQGAPAGGRPRPALLPDQAGRADRPHHRPRARRRRRVAAPERGRDAGRGGRVGVRQEHSGAVLRPAPGADQRRAALSRPGHHAPRPQGAEPAASRGAARLPGPGLLVEPAQARRADRGHAAAAARRGGRRGGGARP